MNIETIVAQCTPSGTGAIALIRISGADAKKIAAKCGKLSSTQTLDVVSTHTIHHGWIIDAQNNHLDEVLFFVMHAPRTFTGEDVVEITCHNNQFLIEIIIGRIISCGARIAQAGEFSRRAVENGKLDLVQVEAIQELIHADSQQQLRLSLEQLEGSLSHWISTVEKKILLIMALCEASFEFLEEEFSFDNQIRTELDAVIEKIASLKNSYDQQKLIREGIRIAIIGSVNAGKSSLFNALIKKNRAIVSDIAGTTRDVVEAGLYKQNRYWTIIDTAGLRETDDCIEKEGIERAYQEAQLADIIVLVMDGSRAMTSVEKNMYLSLFEQYNKKIIKVINKSDILYDHVHFFMKDTISVSTKSNDGIDILENALKYFVEQISTTQTSPFLLNKRHFTLLISLEEKLIYIKKICVQKIEHELLSYHLKEAIQIISELTGKSINEKVLDTIFKEFCVGK